MTGDLRDRLDDLLADVPDHVRTDPRAAWSAGRRRRTRRRVSVAAAVVAVATVTSVAVLGLPRTSPAEPADGPHGSGSYPTRIDEPLRQHDLPARPGRVSGVVQRGDGWYAVSPTGALWHLPGSDPDHPATVSPDGEQVAWVKRQDGSLEWGVEDLRTGVWTPNGSAASGNSGTLIGPGSPTYWSPDSFYVLVPARSGNRNRPSLPRPAVWILAGAGASGIHAPVPGAIPVGWVTGDLLGWLAWPRQPGTGSTRRAVLLVTSTGEGPELRRTVRLGVDISRQEFRGGSLGLGGHALSVTTTTQVLEFGPTGRLVGRSPLPAGAVPHCQVSWGTSQPWVATGSGAPSDAALVSQSGSVLIQADPALHVGCSVWASQALDGAPYRGLGARLFGTSDSWLSWHWRQVAVAAALGLGALLAVGWVAVRRRRRRDLTTTVEPVGKPA